MQGSWLANSNSNRLSSSDRKPSKETDSFSLSANRSSDSTKLEKLSQPFLSPDGGDVQHFTTYDSIRADISCQTDKWILGELWLWSFSSTKPIILCHVIRLLLFYLKKNTRNQLRQYLFLHNLALNVNSYYTCILNMRLTT